jgi:hypothetical protein
MRVRKIIIGKLILILLIMAPARIVVGQIKSYKSGEKVQYLIHYGVINGGIATLELRTDTLKGKEVLHAVMMAKTTGITDAVFKVLDIYESFIDPASELPVRAIRNIREGRYTKYNDVRFDHKSRADSTILKSDLSGVHVVQKGMHDIISAFYWLRNRVLPAGNLRKGQVITIMTWFADELYPIRLRYMGMDEVRTKSGKLKCHKFNPVTEKGRLFKTEEDVSFWLTADKNYLPVKIRFDIFVGSFTIEMVNYEGLVGPLGE